MESLEFNKVAGGVLGTLLFVVALGIVTEGLFSPEPPKKPGWDLPSAPEGGEAKKETEKGESLPNLLASADPEKGKSDTGICATCHNFAKGAGAKIGPDLYGVIGRDKGSVAGFGYSEGMKTKGGKWTFEDLDAFLASPAKYVNGTKMAYAGESDPKKRAEIIVYLDKLSDSPLPLPKPAAAKSDKSEPGKSAEPAGAEKSGKAPDAKQATAGAGGGDVAKGKAASADAAAPAPEKRAAAAPPAAPAGGAKPTQAAKPTEAARPAPATPAPAAPAKPAEAATPAAPAQPAAAAPAAGGASGDPVKGKVAAAICGVCHSFVNGAGAKAGPNLYGVVGRDKASFAGFNYSAAMKAKGGKWTPEDISTFITNPQAYLKGTSMAFAGEPDAQKRGDIVAYLSNLK